MNVSKGHRNQPFFFFSFCSARPFLKFDIKSKGFLFYDKELHNLESLIGLINSDMKK